MPVRFPQSWTSLTNPHVRLELMEYLKEAANPSGHSSLDDVAELVHFIFDDHEFAQSMRLVGKVFISPQEALAVAEFVDRLDGAIGANERPLTTIDSERWKAVAEAAAVAHSTLSELGHPTFE